MNAFERVFRTKALFHGTARSCLLWSSLASILLCLLLVDLYLVADLLVTRGEVALAPGEVEHYEALTGATEVEPAENVPQTRTPELGRTDQGLRATVWTMRDAVWVDGLAELTRRIPLLGTNYGALTLLLSAAAGIGLLRSLIMSRARSLAIETALDVATRTRQTLHRQTLRLGPSDLEDRNGEYALGLFTTEMEIIREWVYFFVSRIGRHPLEFLLLLALALTIHWLLALQCLIPLGACWYLVQRERHRFDSARRLARDRIDAQLKLLAEGLRKTRLVRGYAMEGFEHEHFQQHLHRFRDDEAQVERREGWSRWFIRMLALGCVTIVLYLVGSKVLLAPQDPGRLPFAAAILLLATFAAMYRPLQDLWDMRARRKEAGHAAEKVFRYINRIPEVSQAVGAKFLQPLAKSLTFENVTYSLSNRKRLLDRFDLRLRAGEVTALVSLDPLEARAAAYLLPRFIEPQSGRVLFDGEDTAWVTLESLRAETIYVGGTDPFFTGTVLENISCGHPNYSLQEVTEAAKQTRAHNFIVRLSQGYETPLGEHGERLDAGQGFRLGLARAILRNPALLIIEEPATPLDDDAKSLLDDVYHRITQSRTVIFLPARMSTLRRADRIVLIHRGKVEAVGTHAELIKTSPLYRHWEYTRFNEFRSLTGNSTDGSAMVLPHSGTVQAS